MTKNIFIVAIAVLLSVAFCSLSAQNVSKDYNVGDFFCHQPAICRKYYFRSIGRMYLPFGRAF